MAIWPWPRPSSAPAAARSWPNPTAGRGPVPPAVTPRPALAIRSRSRSRPTMRRRPAGRVVVLHRPPARHSGPALRLRVRRLPRRAGRIPGDLGVAPGDPARGRPARRSTTPSAARSAPRSTSPRRCRAARTPRPRDLRRGAGPAARRRSPWVMRQGSDGRDRLTARAESGGGECGRCASGLGLDMQLTARAAVLHDDDGWVDFGPAGRSCCCSRSAMDATGSMTCWTAARSTSPGPPGSITEWGDFISVGGGGCGLTRPVELDNGADLMLSLVRSPMEPIPVVCGTLVDGSGTGSAPRSDGVPGDPQRDLAIGPDRGGISGGLDDRDPRPADCRIWLRRPCFAGSGARHASEHRRGLLGGLRRSSTPPGRRPVGGQRTWS